MKKTILLRSGRIGMTVFSFFLFLSFFIANISAIAQNDKDYFYVKYDNQSSVLYFQWNGEDKNENLQFVIWHADGLFKEFDANSFKEFAKTNSSESRQGNGMYLYKMEYQLDLTLEHSFCLQTIKSDGSTDYSNVFILNQINIEPSQKITFTVFPDDKAAINKPYESKIQAEYSDDKTKTIYYELKGGPDGMSVDKTTGDITWTPKENHPTQVWIRAYISDNSKVFADFYYEIRIRTCETPVVISGIITNKFDEPVASGFLVLYSTKPDNNKPEEKMGVDVVNGVYSIEADEGEYFMIFYDQQGRYFLYENATNNEDMKSIKVECGKNLTIDWKISDYSDRTYNVSGKVLDNDGNPVPNWNVFFQTGIDKNQENQRFYSFSTMTDQNGNYTIKLPDGYTYYAYTYTQMENFNKYNFNTLYYNQTFDLSKATKLELTGDLSNIDFRFIDNPDFTYYVVKGTVLDVNNTPLQGVMVAFEGFNDNEGQNDKYYKFYDQVYTDVNGNYAIKLPSIFKYIAYAVNTAITNNSEDKGMPLFYNQTFSREEAKIITLSSDLSGINFIFKVTNSHFNNHISGTVTDTTGAPISFAFVEAINTDEDQHFDKAHHFHYGYTDDNGNFVIKGLEPGKYILFASTQHSEEFLCGYYVENATASIQYEDATKIDVSETSSIEGINIVLPKFLSKNGGGIIKGQVYNNSNYSESNKANSAVSSAKIYLEENPNSLASFQESNADGSFVISGLTAGTYNFVVEKSGFQKYTKNVEVTENAPVDLGLILLVPISGNGVNDNTPVLTSGFYPNPSKNEVNINFISSSNNVTINFYSLDGKLVKEINTNVTIGYNTLLINLDELNSGQYIVVINDGKQRTSVSVILQK